MFVIFASRYWISILREFLRSVGQRVSRVKIYARHYH